MESSAGADAKSITKYLAALFVLIGIVLITGSVFLRSYKQWQILPDVMRELGVVVLAVFTVSLIYERSLAEKHLQKFQLMLREEVKQTETIASSCARLGIAEIFISRNEFEFKYPLDVVLREFDSTANLRIIAVSLFHIMNKADALKRAMTAGATIELCMMGSTTSSEVLTLLPDLEIHDIRSTISTFKKEIVSWVKTAKPSGTMELRFHDAYLFQSYATFKSQKKRLGIWDLSFGRDLRDKRTIVLDADGTLGADLDKRFGRIYEVAKPVFRYKSQKVEIDIPSD